MHREPNVTTPSNFNTRSDRAALALKAGMKDFKTKQPLQQRSVPVDADGQPARPLPPEGSYARQIIERQRAATAQQRATTDPQSGAPPAEQQDPAPGQPEGQPEPTADPQLTPNAQRRFGELTQTLRQKDQELQAAQARNRQAEQQAAEAAQRAAAAEQRYQQLVQQNLEHLDPETRAAVLQDARMQESMGQLEERLMGRIAPVLNGMQAQAVQADRVRLSQKYQGYSPQVHDPLIDIFREKNPNCTVEQAFRAIAEPEELQVREGRGPTVPPIANPAPGNRAPRYVPEPQQQTSPEQEIEEDRQRAYALSRSTKPLDRRQVGPAFDRLIRSKLGNALPGQRR